MTSNYISSVYHRATDSVLVFERDEDGRRVVQYPAPWYFYVPDENGQYKSTYGHQLKKLEFSSRQEFDEAVSAHSNKHESDIAPELKVLMNNYYGKPAPTLNIGLLDIEVNYRQGSTDPNKKIKIRRKSQT